MKIREILFRGKTCKDKRWVYGSYIKATNTWNSGCVLHKSWITDYVMANGGWLSVTKRYAVEDDSVGEFSGLTDKNGVKIFEGDVVRVEGGAGLGAFEVVHYSSGGFAPFSISGWECVPDAEDCEVIGNIYDDPDLRKIAGRH